MYVQVDGLVAGRSAHRTAAEMGREPYLLALFGTSSSFLLYAEGGSKTGEADGRRAVLKMESLI